MSLRVQLELPEGALSALRASPEQFVRELRLAAAVKWYEMQQVSQSEAVEIAGVSRRESLDALARYNVPVFQITREELEAEVGRE